MYKSALDLLTWEDLKRIDEQGLNVVRIDLYDSKLMAVD
jgi:hypothetical protein